MQNTHWIQGGADCDAPLFRRSFSLKERPASATLEICGLGYFLLYVNGKRVGNQEFAPAMTNYASVLGCETTYPVWEERSGYRCLYLVFDLLPYLREGENVLGIRLGNGWYHQTKRIAEGKFIFGLPKLRFELMIKYRDREELFLESDPQTLWKPGELVENNLFYGETQDIRLWQEDWCSVGAAPGGWASSRPVHAPQAQLTRQTCPPDRVLRGITPVLLEKAGERALYDCGENIAGWVTIRCKGKRGEEIRIRHSEELTADGRELDFASAGGKRQIQEDRYICDGAERVAHPLFCWHAFRYFEVEGPGEAVSVSVVCTDVPVTSSFRCSDPVLNWLYDAYIRTQANNYHGCIPSDCPHRERLGYTGDGQLTAETAMMLFDAKGLYEKWYQDILDSQGADTGHIPHTAPFLGGGGGPGGWGSAVYVVPMSYYQVYGDTALLTEGYPAVIRWLEYMDSRCEEGLVVREEEGGWCLGEWCAPATETGMLPEAFVNTYYYIQGLRALKRMAEILHKEAPVWTEERIERSLRAFSNAWYDQSTGDFAEGIGGGNAFALNLGLGDERTKRNLVSAYRSRGRLDTGIFGTPVLIERLFAEGEGDLAIQLLTGPGPASFAHMMESGATTLWEDWDGRDSHDHPMFGAVVKVLFTEILGIRQKEGSSGFTDYEIKPASITSLEWAEGSIRTAAGTIEVKWERASGKLRIIRQ